MRPPHHAPMKIDTVSEITRQCTEFGNQNFEIVIAIKIGRLRKIIRIVEFIVWRRWCRTTTLQRNMVDKVDLTSASRHGWIKTGTFRYVKLDYLFGARRMNSYSWLKAIKRQTTPASTHRHHTFYNRLSNNGSVIYCTFLLYSSQPDISHLRTRQKTATISLVRQLHTIHTAVRTGFHLPFEHI